MNFRLIIILSLISIAFSSCFLLLQDCESDFQNRVSIEIYDESGKNMLDTLKDYGDKLLNINDEEGMPLLFQQVSIPDDPMKNVNNSFLRIYINKINHDVGSESLDSFYLDFENRPLDTLIIKIERKNRQNCDYSTITKLEYNGVDIMNPYTETGSSKYIRH